MRKQAIEALRNMRTRTCIEAYAIAAVAAVLAALSLVDDLVSDDVRWAAVLAGVGVLVYRVTLPEDMGKIADDDRPSDRSFFTFEPFTAQLVKAKKVWVLTPSTATVLSAPNCETIRQTALRHEHDRLWVIVLNPDEAGVVALEARQYSDSVGFPAEEFEPALRCTICRLNALAAGDTHGIVEWRLASHDPGFYRVGIDVPTQAGVIIVEFHACHNVSTENRTHSELPWTTLGPWYAHSQRQFDEARKQSSASCTVSAESGDRR